MKKMFSSIITILSTAMISVFALVNVMTALSASAAEDAQPDLEVIAEEMAAKFNEARAELGLEPVYIIPYLNEVSEVRANEIVDLYSHTRPDGSKFSTAIDTSVVDYQYSYEILARGASDIDLMFNAWKNSPTHWSIITQPKATHMGISLVHLPDSDKQWYWAATFVGTFDRADVEGQRMPLEMAPAVLTVQNDASEINDNIATFGSLKEDDPSTMLVLHSNGDEPENIAPISTGDINNDGEIDIFDVVYFLKYFNNKVTLSDAQLKAADINADGNVDTLDSAILRMYVIGDIDSLQTA